MQFFGLALFLLTFFPQTHAWCDIGQVDTIVLCYDAYMQAFGLPSLLNAAFFPPYLFVDQARREYLTKGGPDYLAKVCSANTDLYNCMIGVVQKDCMEMSVIDGAEYWMDMYASYYQCTKGYAIWEKDFACINDARDKNLNDLRV
ncbi:unnamed protein product, partial [Mesorhabditis belari]|uniref:Uncharacterized protein n=1 Tax=Mesorhabditis belari TaxID=2138241 RepID=A0AAF3F053_9BILA